METIELKKEFTGIGEVKRFEFTQIQYTVLGYVYKVVSSEGNIHFEVFKRKNTPTCLDFEKRIYSDTKFKEVYPKSKDFGVWAWTFNSLDKANYKLLKMHIKS